MLAFFGHMWANKCNYEQDVITIALLLKLLYALMAWLTIYAGGWNCLLFSQEEKNTPEVWPLLYYICENTTFKCRIWLSKNRTRKPFNRNSRERKLFKSWYSMKDYENGGHRTRQNCKYNEENLLLCVNTWGQFILLCWAIRGYFQPLGKKEQEGSHHVQVDQSDGLGWYQVVMVSSSHTDPAASGQQPEALFLPLVKQLKILPCIQSLREEWANLPMSGCPNARLQASDAFNMIKHWSSSYLTHISEISDPTSWVIWPALSAGLFGDTVRRKEVTQMCIWFLSHDEKPVKVTPSCCLMVFPNIDMPSSGVVIDIQMR